jgi:uncharacterized protein
VAERSATGDNGVGLAELGTLGATRLLKPDYLSSADLPWLQTLLAERSRFAGQTRREWCAHVAGALGRAPVTKLRVAMRVFDRLIPDCAGPSSLARKVRAVVFREGALGEDRDRALAAAAAQLGLSIDDVAHAMFADLPDERRLAAPGDVDASQLVPLCNESIIFGLLQRALRVRIRAHGQVRAVVRQARLTGLLCVVREGSTASVAELEVSGPFALFRHSRLYGRALASLVPRLSRCNAFRLEAECVLARGGELGRLVIRSGDPIQPARALPDFDSRVEEHFARDFARLALEWEVIREPQPISVGHGLFFPDFELRRRTTGDQYWVEIVGFWTPEYLAKKLEQLAQARLERMIVCVDVSHERAAGQLEAIGRVVRYKRRVDARDVIAIVDPALAGRLDAPAAGERSPGRRRGRAASNSAASCMATRNPACAVDLASGMSAEPPGLPRRRD